MTTAQSDFYNDYLTFCKAIHIYLNHFPKHEKYGLCKRIRDLIYDIFDIYTEYTLKYYKKTTSTNLIIKAEQLKFNILLSYQLGYLNFHNGHPHSTMKGEKRFNYLTELLVPLVEQLKSIADKHNDL